MADKSAIEWTDATWPVVQGCDYDSPGCAHCYAVSLIWRLSHNPDPTIAEPLQGLVEKRGDNLVWTGKIALREDRLKWPLQWKRPRMIFVPSHGDLFHPDVPDAFIDRVFEVFDLTARHTYQVLTKRADRMRRYMINRRPPANVWLGVSVEDQKRAEERIPHLLATAAARRFLSCEPLLGPVLPWTFGIANEARRLDANTTAPGIDWIIAGGESGHSARPTHPDWLRSLCAQCQSAEVPFFFKQWGAWLPRIDRDSHDPDWRLDYTILNREADTYRGINLAGGIGFHGERFHVMKRVGKKAAGAMLDGREWREFPS